MNLDWKYRDGKWHLLNEDRVPVVIVTYKHNAGIYVDQFGNDLGKSWDGIKGTVEERLTAKKGKHK